MTDSLTSEVIHRFEAAFQQHDTTPFGELVTDDCILENTGPAPDGQRYEGHEAVVAFWSSIAGNPDMHFEEEEVFVAGDRAVIRW